MALQSPLTTPGARYWFNQGLQAAAMLVQEQQQRQLQAFQAARLEREKQLAREAVANITLASPLPGFEQPEARAKWFRMVKDEADRWRLEERDGAAAQR